MVNVPSPCEEGLEYGMELLAAGLPMPWAALAQPGVIVGRDMGYTPTQWHEFRRGVMKAFIQKNLHGNEAKA